MVAVVLFTSACASPGRSTRDSGPTAGSRMSDPQSASGTLSAPSVSTTSPAEAASTAAGPVTVTAAPLLARGQQRPAADIPWRQVGRNWFLALWTSRGRGAAPVSLFLVNPVGGRYLVHTWPAGTDSRWLEDWSGDARRVLIGGASPSVMDLSSGATTLVAGFPSINAAGFTRPSGTNVVLAVAGTEQGSEVDTILRVDANGGHPVTLGTNVRQWLYALDGKSLVLDGVGALPVVDNNGRLLRTIATPGGQSCRPIRWWSDHRLLVGCGVFELWLLSTANEASQQLTTTPPQSDSPTTFGNNDIYPVGHDLYVDASGPCGGTFLARVNRDGTTTVVDVPGADAPGLRQFLLGTDGSHRLALLAMSSCESGNESSVAWFDPKVRHLDTLLGSGVNGGDVLSALEFAS